MKLKELFEDFKQPEFTLKKSLKWSLIAHVVILFFLLVKGWLFPTAAPYLPTLRVDLVALPDVLKKDLELMKNLPPVAEMKTETAPEAQKEETLPDDEMVLHPKKKKTEKDSTQKNSKAAREKALKAIQRIKALSQVEEAESESTASAIVKGNSISKGTTLSGDAIEAAEKSYYDDVLSKLQDNWSIPIYLSRQELSAQVVLMIDARGRVNNIRFTKSSGNPQFDEAVRRAIAASDPFPRPPEELRNQLIDRGILLGFPL